MDINVRVHFTADSVFANMLSDVTGALAALSIAQSGKDGHLPPKTVPEPPKEAPKAEAKPATKTEPKKEEAKKEELKGEPVSPAKAKEINDLVKDTPKPDDVIDHEMAVKTRARIADYCKVVGVEAGRESVKNWLNKNGFTCISKLTYKGKDALVAFIEAEVKGKKEVA